MRIHFILLISLVMSLSGLSNAQVNPPAYSETSTLAVVALELLRRAAESDYSSNPVISSPAMNNILRHLSHGARHQTRAEIDELGIPPQNEELSCFFRRLRMLIATGQGVQINNRFRELLRESIMPVYFWRRYQLELDTLEIVNWVHNDNLQGSLVNEMPRFIDWIGLQNDYSPYLQIISEATIAEPLHKIPCNLREELTSVSNTAPTDIQTLESEQQRTPRAYNSQIVSHLDFTERLSHLLPTAFSPQADFSNLLRNGQASLRRVVEDTYFRTSENTVNLTSIARFTFSVSPVTAHSLLTNLALNPLRRIYQAARALVPPPPAGNVPPLLFGLHQDSPHRCDPFQLLDLREDGSFSMTRSPGFSYLENFRVSGTWKLVPCDDPSQYQIDFSNIQNTAVGISDHAFEDISVNFKWVNKVTVLDVEDSSFNRAGKNENHDIYTYYSSIVFEQNPIEMVYQQHPNAQPDDANNDKKTFYPLSGQVRGYYKLPSKDQGN